MKLDSVETIDNELEKLWILREAIENIQTNLRERREEIVSNNAVKEIVKGLTPEKYLNFPFWGQINQKTYSKLHGWFEQNYFDHGIVSHGRLPNGQPYIEMCFDQNIPFDDQLGLLDFWPYIEPFEDGGETVIKIGIFEHTLSARYCYSLRSVDQKETIIIQTHYGNELFKTTDIREAMMFVYKKHPYKQHYRGVASDL